MLQPTRTIGDYYLKKAEHFCGKGEFKGPYLSHEPQICVHQIELNDTRIILASDGLWDYLKKWEVVKEVVDDYEDDKLTTASS
jgi:serine/threonine protein phosphatase PrpC